MTDTQKDRLNEVEALAYLLSVIDNRTELNAAVLNRLGDIMYNLISEIQSA